MSVGLSRGSQKRGFKNAPEPHSADGNDEKKFWYRPTLFESTLRYFIIII